MTQAEQRFARLIQESSTANVNKVNGLGRTAIIAVGLSCAAVVAADYGFGFAPRVPEGHALAPMAFFPALVAASRYGGRVATWIVVTLLLIVEALYLPPQGMGIDPEFWPWYFQYAGTLCSVALLLSPIRRDPHTTDQGISQSKRFGIVRNRLPSLFSFSQDLIE